MNLDKIIKDNWPKGLDVAHPVNRRMKEVFEKYPEMSRENIRFLINEIVRQKGGVYFEAGAFQGAGLMCASFQTDALVIGCDDYSSIADLLVLVVFLSMIVGDSCDRKERQCQDEEDKGLDQADEDL